MRIIISINSCSSMNHMLMIEMQTGNMDILSVVRGQYSGNYLVEETDTLLLLLLTLMVL